MPGTVLVDDNNTPALPGFADFLRILMILASLLEFRQLRRACNSGIARKRVCARASHPCLPWRTDGIHDAASMVGSVHGFTHLTHGSKSMRQPRNLHGLGK
jgi:hypothetical protein